MQSPAQEDVSLLFLLDTLRPYRNLAKMTQSSLLRHIRGRYRNSDNTVYVAKMYLLISNVSTHGKARRGTAEARSFELNRTARKILRSSENFLEQTPRTPTIRGNIKTKNEGNSLQRDWECPTLTSKEAHSTSINRHKLRQFSIYQTRPLY